VASAWLAIIILPRIGRFWRLVVRRMVAFGEWSFGEWSPSGIGRSEIGRSENGRSGIGRSGNGRCTKVSFDSQTDKYASQLSSDASPEAYLSLRK
jgi:hypothetical protein